ncbi:MAG: 2Fe-2S iron-sulfur cluster-binding protein [Candidatus Sedimenticola sp. 1PA]
MTAFLADLKTRHQVTILDTNEAYTCFSDQHLLKGMVSLGKRGIPSGCHGGGCGVCKVQIVSGEVEVLSMSRDHVSEEEEKTGVVLACRVFPKGDVALKVIGKLSKNVLRPSTRKKYGFV